MAKRKFYFLYFILIIVLVFGVITTKKLVYAALSCFATSTCVSPNVVIFRMSGAINAHAELANQSTATYNANLVCCTGGPAGFATSCSSGVYAVALKLSSTTNAHVEEGTRTLYANNVCISVPTGGSVSVGTSTNCAGSGYDTTLASMSAPTNAHVGTSTAYAIKICATAALSSIISIVITTDGLVDYGIVPLGSSTSTLPSSRNDQQLVVNNGNVAEIFSIKGSTSTPANWVLGSSPANSVYQHQFSTTTGTVWVSMNSESYVTATTSVPVNSTSTLDLKLWTPTGISDFTQQNVDVTIMATQG